MAILESLDRPDTSVVLAARHLVGRSKVCFLHLDDRQISGEHASLEWKGSGWEVRDLGSRNGTYIDGKRLDAGARAPLVRGAELRFAQTSRWKLVDDSPPVAMAVPLTDPSIKSAGSAAGGPAGGPAGGSAGSAAGGPAGSAAATVTAEDGLLALPRGSDSPEVCIYQDSAGRWIAERHDREDLISDCDYVMAGQSTYRVHLPDIVATTSSPDEVPSIHELGLRFAVSSDEEYVELHVRLRKREWTLEPRAHLYPLLILARARLRDRQESALPASAHGWVYQDDLVEMLNCSPNRLHTDIYRARRQLAALGIAGAAALVERRATSKQIRIGVEDIDIATI